MSAFFVLVFFLCLFLIFYVYAGYPLVVLCVGILRPKPVVRSPDYEPLLTVLIPAHNEEEGIAATLENKLALAYPSPKLEIVVVSDGSTDRTDEIVKSYADAGVRLIRQEPRAGKTMALNLALSTVQGDIVVFSDANSMYAPDALNQLVQNFADPRVGYVTGKMVYTNSEQSTVGDGCSAYMKYENLLRSIESRIGSVVGVNGGIDAVRRDLYKPMNADQLPDLILPLQVVEQGFRVVYEPRAILKEPSLSEVADEHKMRVRVTLRALWALHDMRHLLSLRQYGMFAFQLWSHKVLRYLCFIFLIGAYVSNLVLYGSNIFFEVFFILQTAAYAAALVSSLLEKREGRSRMFYLLRYFVLVNFSAAFGVFKFLRGQKQVLWTPRKG